MPQKIIVSKVRLRLRGPHFQAMHLACAHLSCSLSTLKTKTNKPGMYYALNTQTGATCSFDKQDHKPIITSIIPAPLYNVDLINLPSFRLLADVARYFGVSPECIKKRIPRTTKYTWFLIIRKDGRKAYYRRRND